MPDGTRFSCFLAGSESLLVQCGELLLEAGHEIRGIVTDSPVALRFARERGLPTIDPGSDLTNALGAEPFDHLFCIAHLSLIPEAVLALPRGLAINFHDGPLPRYAGLHATSWALLHGESSHGVTWHVMTSGVDEGDVLIQRRIPVREADTALTLNARCFEAGIESFCELLDRLSRGELEPTPQDLSRRSYFGRNERPPAAAVLDWNRGAEELDALVRALDFGDYRNPLGLPKMLVGGELVLVRSLEVLPEGSDERPGTVLDVSTQGIRVATGSLDVRVSRLANAAGRPVAPGELALHHALAGGVRLELLSRGQGEWLGTVNEELAGHESFWVRRLAAVEPMQPPYAEGALSSGSVRRLETRRLPLPDALRWAADRREGAATDAALAAFAALLARTSGRTRFDVGFRDAGLAARITGFEAFFASYVPLRIEVGEDSDFLGLASALGRELARVRRRGTHARDVALRHPELRGADVALPVNLEIADDLDELEPGAEGALTFAVAADGSEALICYDEDVLGASAVACIEAQLAALFQAAVDDPTRHVSRLPLLSSEERRRLLEEWNRTGVEYDRSRCVHEEFEAQVARTPDRTAVCFEDDSYTFRQLEERANRLAHYLIELQVGPDVLVGVCLERSIEMVVAILAVQKAGGAYLPLDPAFPAERIAFMIEDAEAPILLTQESLLASLPEHGALSICLDTNREQIAERPVERPEVQVTPANLAYVIYTSGSTGRPNGVLVEHRNVLNLFTGMDRRIDRDTYSVWLSVTSLSFDISVLELLWTLSRGIKVVIQDELRRKPAAAAASQRRRVDFSLFYFSSAGSEASGDLYELVTEGAKFADSHGFKAVWTPERHFHDFGGLFPNPSVLGAALASITRNVRIRAGSCVLPLHTPIRVAEEWAVVDNLSGGRVDLGVASGWQPNDFAIRPESYADSKKVTVEQLEVVRRLWRGESVDFPGPTGDVRVRTLPRPIQQELPVWITTAGNPETWEQAARLGAGVLTHLVGQTLVELGEKIERYRAVWRQCGHPGEGTVTLMLHTYVGDDDEAVRATVREPMKDYLRSAMSLVKEAAWYFPTFQRMREQSGRSLDEIFDSVTEEETDALLDFAFDRYFESSGLFGTPERCIERVQALAELGVDEIACLIDFGVAGDDVLAHLPHLDRVRLECARGAGSGAGNTSLADAIEHHGVTHMQCTPSAAKLMLADERNRRALGSLQVMMLGGEALPAPLVRELSDVTEARLLNFYGPTETTVWSSTYPVDPSEQTIAIGRPIANTRFYVVDDHGEPVPAGVAGELWIGGEGVVRGYHHRPEKTLERFVPDPFSDEPGARVYRTGDRVRYRSDGTLEFLGRLDFQVKIRGYRIELGEIEARLGFHPHVRECVVAARAGAEGGEQLVAYVVPAAGRRVDAQELRQALRDALPDYMIPTHFVSLQQLPLTPNAKIDRAALPAPEEVTAPKPLPGAPPSRPENSIQRTLAGIWRDVLNLESVGPDDNFFDLGGHSLLAVQVHRRIREAIGGPLSLTDLFRHPTLRALSERLGEEERAPRRPLENRATARRDAAARRRLRRERTLAR